LWSMTIFRQKYIKTAMIFFTGIIFLNMSFFLAEVTALKLAGNKALVENIAKLISGGGLEEEKDASTETAEGGDVTVKEVDLLAHHAFIHHAALSLIAQGRNGILNDTFSYFSYLEIFSPPPEA
jgi:hypothetical protein